MKVAQMALPYKIVCIEDKPSLDEQKSSFLQSDTKNVKDFLWKNPPQGQMNVMRGEATAKF